MRTYKVWVADKFTKWPLGWYNVKALSKWHATRKVFKNVCQKDKSYLLMASAVK